MGRGDGFWVTFSPLTLFCLLPCVAPRQRRGQRRSSASGFPGARCGGSPERSGDRPALPDRPAASPGQQRGRRSPHGETQPRGRPRRGGGWGQGCGRGPGHKHPDLWGSDAGRREVEVRVSPRPWLVASPGRHPMQLGRTESCSHKGRFVAWAPHFPSEARPPLRSSSSELPPWCFPSFFPPFSSLLSRAPFLDRVNIPQPLPSPQPLGSGYL